MMRMKTSIELSVSVIVFLPSRQSANRKGIDKEKADKIFQKGLTSRSLYANL